MFLLSLPPQKELRCHQKRDHFKRNKSSSNQHFPENLLVFRKKWHKKVGPPPKKTTHVLIKAIGSMGLVDLFAWMIDSCSKCIGRYTNVPWMRSWERTFHGKDFPRKFWKLPWPFSRQDKATEPSAPMIGLSLLGAFHLSWGMFWRQCWRVIF